MATASAPLATAIFTAAIAIAGKAILDAWDRYRQRQSVAGALHGEISAYLALMQAEKLVISLRAIAAADQAARKIFFASFPTLPTSHPVFDRVADKIGCLPLEVATEVSRFYNIISGMRLLLMNMSSPAFLQTSPDIQTYRLTFMAQTIEDGLPELYTLLGNLKSISREWFFHS